MISGLKIIKKIIILLLTVISMGFITYELIKYSPEGAMNEFYNYQINNNKIDNKFKSRLTKINLSKSDELLLKAYELMNKDADKAKKYLLSSVNNIDNSTTETGKVYIYKFLSYMELKEGNINKAVEYVNDAFINISSINYKKYYKVIWEMLSPLMTSKEGRNLALVLLNQMNDNSLSKEGQLFLHKKLSVVNMSLSNYDKAMDHKFYINRLSLELKDYYSYYKNILDISTIARMEGNYDLAIGFICDVDESNIENILHKTDIKTYKYISLAKIYVIMGEADKSLEALEKVSNYDDILHENRIDDLQILENIIKCEAYIIKGEYAKAKISLEKANKLMKNDIKEVYIDKDIEYLLASGMLNEKQESYKKAEIDYEKAIELSQSRSNMELLKTATKRVSNVYQETNDIEKAKACNEKLSYLTDHKNKKISKVYYEHIFFVKNHLE